MKKINSKILKSSWTTFLILFFSVQVINLLLIVLVGGFWDGGLYLGIPKAFYVINCGFIRGDYICPRGFDLIGLIIDLLLWFIIAVLIKYFKEKRKYFFNIEKKVFFNSLIIISVIVITGFLIFRKQTFIPQQSHENTSLTDTSQSIPAAKEDISSCVSASNYTYRFYVVFTIETVAQNAEKILLDNNVETFHQNAESPSGYSFELPNNNMCTPLENIFKVKDTFRIPVLYRQAEKDQPVSGPVNLLSCPNIPDYFIIPNGYISNNSNNFYLAYYQNGDQLKEALENIGAYNIVPTGDKKKTYNATFQNGKICQSVNSLRENPNIYKIETIPYLPGPPPIE